jgi:hypothetical protein
MSILMTRIPGKDLGNCGVYQTMSNVERESVFAELDCIIQIMSKRPHPGSKEQISSMLVCAFPIRQSARVSPNLISTVTTSSLSPATS